MAKAGKMLRASKKWREEHRIDYILQEYKVPEVLSTKYNPIGVVGHDKSLNPGNFIKNLSWIWKFKQNYFPFIKCGWCDSVVKTL